MTSMLNRSAPSAGTFLKWVENFINGLNDIVLQFSFLENEISCLQLASRELEVISEEIKLRKRLQQIAAAEKKRCVTYAMTSSIILINRLEDSPNWTDNYREALKIYTLPAKAGIRIAKKRPGNDNYCNNEQVIIMDWLKNFNHILAESGNMFEVQGVDIKNMQAITEKVNDAFREYYIARNNYFTLLTKKDISVQELMKNIRTIVRHLKASRGWTEDHAVLLNVQQAPIIIDFTNYKPVVQLVECDNHVKINFLKNDGVNGMNVYSRLQGEIDFSFLRYTKRSQYRDPRPLKPGGAETREYRLNAVAAGKEIGHPSDVVSIHIARYGDISTLTGN